MVHALEGIHRGLTEEGVLLDLHPQPVNMRVEVWQQGRVEPLGPLEQEDDIRDIRRARVRLNRVQRRGLFATERRRTFEMLGHFPSVEAWEEWQVRQGYTDTMPERILVPARRLLAAGGGELIFREKIRASLLRRRPSRLS